MTRVRLLDLLSAALVGTLSLAALLLGAQPSLAAADDPEPEVSDQVEPTPATDPMHQRWDRLLGVELTGGVDTPYGVVGASLLAQPLRNLRIDLGGGVSRDGARVAGGLSLVLPQDHFALVLRAGAAGGPLTWDSSDRAVHIHRYYSFAAYFDWSLGLEYRFDEGILLRLYAGGETVLNSASDSCVATAPDTTTGLEGNCVNALGDHPSRLYIGLSVGYMFDIFL
ncbi:MAG: hypothetical protein U0234_12920 [Sandaracinus sp.]